MIKMKTKKIFADKVNELLAKQNGEDSSDESAAELEAPRVSEFLEEEYELPQKQSTEFRKRNVKLLSEQSAKYKGKVTSRKELEDESEQESETEGEDAAEAFKSFGNQLKQISKQEEEKEEIEELDEEDDDEIDTEEEEEEDDDDEIGSEEEDFDDDDDGTEEEEEEEEENDVDQEIVSETNRQKEIQKGVCVQNQLRIWEKLLEMRIQSQKMLTKANQLPAPDEFQAIENVDALKTETVENVGTLLSKLLELQQALSQQYPEIRTSQKRASQTLASNDEPPSKRFGSELQQHFKKFSNYRNDVLMKWDDRTKVMTPGGGKRKSAQEDYNILKKIDFVLNNRQALIKRSQTLKTSAMSDETEAATVMPHIYDDSDFYHHQLRELIEYKSNTSSSMAEVTKQYVELQKLRQKMKKKVDTRASKGRKIRYVVHNKLVNYMAPEDTSSWTAQSKDELYKSLFVA